MKKYDWSKEKISSVLKDCFCYRDVLRKLNIPIAGRNSTTLKKKIAEYNLDISHFNVSYLKTHRGKHCNHLISNVSNDEIFRLNSNIKNSIIKREYIIRILSSQPKCECCGITNWNNKSLVFQLHHIDGNNRNNAVSNLQLLCPNCHSQTNNFCNKNSHELKKEYICPICGNPHSSRSKMCRSCADKERAKHRPTKEALSNLLKTKNNTQIGQELLVTEACVRKWRRMYSI